MNKRRLLLVSCSIILLCMLSIVGMTFALFTSSVGVRNHLVAGSLDVTLHRTDLAYTVLDSATGKLITVTDPEDINFSNPQPDKNIFGIDTNDLKVVPGSFFEATLKLTSDGSCAYDYSVTIVLMGHSDESGRMVAAVNDLAKQLRVTITDPELHTTTMMLSEMLTPDNAYSIDVGSMTPGTLNQTFKVKVEFVDDVNQIFTNNDAKGRDVYFDVIVTATQATE